MLKTGETIYVDNPSKLPDVSAIEDMREPIVRANILVPQEHLGNVITLCIEKRGVQVDMAEADWSAPGALSAAKRLMRQALAVHLGGRPLVSRELFRKP